MKRRSNPKKSKGKNTYGPKRRSGNMMFGPTRSVEKYPQFRAKYPRKGWYWWEEDKGRKTERDYRPSMGGGLARF